MLGRRFPGCAVIKAKLNLVQEKNPSLSNQLLVRPIQLAEYNVGGGGKEGKIAMNAFQFEPIES